MPSYTCAICQRAVEYADRLPSLYPFCSPRCKYVDLGKWLQGEYTIDRELSPEEAADSFEPSPDKPE